MKCVAFSMTLSLALVATAPSANAQDSVGDAPVSRSRSVVLTAQEQKSETDKPGKRTITTTIESETAYDTWEIRDGDDGDVVSESLKLTMELENLGTPGDTLTIDLEGAYVWADVSQDGTSDSTGHFSDTDLTFDYTLPLSDSQRWRGGLELDFNLPTGLTEANDNERAIEPADDAITKSFLGTGFDAGIAARLMKTFGPENDSNYFVGIGAKHRGRYDTNEEEGVGTQSSGAEYKGFFGFEKLRLDHATLGFTGTYTRNQGYRDEISNKFESEIDAAFDLPDDFDLEATYTVTLKDEQPDDAVPADRDVKFEEGFDNELETTLRYHFGDPAGKDTKEWTLFGTFTGAIGDKSRPRDDDFFSRKRAVSGQAGLKYNLSPESNFSASLKRSEVVGEDSTDGTSSLSGWTGLFGINIEF